MSTPPQNEQADVELAERIVFRLTHPLATTLLPGELTTLIATHCQPLRQRIVELEKALEKYQSHLPSCEIRRWPNSKCTCGLESALREQKGQDEAK